ncbi:MAG: hypothetical protein PT977_01915 [Acidobacteriota bacterium]|nr:hypothetical protein [Acidobacteriota bacterium]
MFRTFAFIAALFAALLGLLTAWSRETRREVALGRGADRAGGRVERCVTCHEKASEDPGGAHARAALGCASCHLGNALAFSKERAHEGLEREPGALSTVALTCGREGCHAREASRVATSPMTRNAGMVAVDRFAFGEIVEPDGARTIGEVLAAAHPTRAESHLRKLCAGCHLGTRRANRDDLIHGNGSGCAACHVARKVDDKPRRHPPVDSKVTDDRCFGCHSGSERIALSYQGLVEVEKGKPYAHAAPDVHQAAGMACIDCHLHTDLMGDGSARTHKEEQVEITCEACHGPVRTGGEAAWLDVKDEISIEIRRRGDFLRKGKREDGRPPDAPARLGKRGTPLINLLRKSSSSSWVLVRQLDGVELPVKRTPRDRNHTLRGHERLSCSACHAAWVPTCDSCHTSFSPSGKQWDFAAGKETAGAWVERSEGFSWASPLLGVRADGRIVPAAPGMILDVDASAAGGGKSSRRLLAPAEPHTTGKKARTCESCHRAPPQPQFEAGTRTGFRGLDSAERKRLAGAKLDRL